MSGLSLGRNGRRRRDVFDPREVPEVSAMLTLAKFTDTGTLSIPDAYAANPATQATAGRKPTIGVASNGVPIATFVRANPSQLVWPVAANNNATAKWGFACWVRMTTNGAFHCLFNLSSGAFKVELYLDSNRRARVSKFGQDSSGYNGRDALTAINSLPAAGTWFFFRYQFDGSQATEVLRDKIFLNEVDQSGTSTYSNIGTGGTPVALRVASGNAFIGNYQDNTDSTYGLDAALGPRAYVLNASPSVADGLRLMAFDRPT